MKRVSLAEASSRDWDVILAGTSIASMFFGRGLPEGLDVLFIEKGGDYPHATQIEKGWAVREQFVQRNSSGHEKHWVAFTVLGGNSNYWWANSPRLHPNDFVLQSKFGVGLDWPFGYDDLEPYWTRAEEIMEIAGGASEHILPRSRPFPYPPHAPSRSDAILRESSPLWVPMATAISNGGSRPHCCVNGVCSICPIDAKFTVLNGFEALEHPRASFLLETEVREVDIEAGRAGAVRVRGPDGEEARLRGNVVALGTNAIFNTTILKRSGVENEALGRYLHEQAILDLTIDTANIKAFFGGTSETGHGYHFYHDIDRSDAAAVLIETINAPPAIRPERGRWANRLRMRLIAEDLPRPENRVLLEDDAPAIEWIGHHDYALRGLDRALEGLPALIPDTIENLEVSSLLPSEAHIQGTHRMGASPGESVVDGRLRLHGVPNLFVLGSGAFPACSPANPTLTIAALSLRAAEAVT